MPWLDLVSEYHFNLALVLSTGAEERLQHTIDGKGHLGAERADIIHYTVIRVSVHLVILECRWIYRRCRVSEMPLGDLR